MSRDALVVGINTYHYLPGLQAPANDAESVARCLENWGECRVLRMPEAVRQQRPVLSSQVQVTTPMLEAALIRLFKPTGKTIPQTAIFYYSGHGLQRDVGIQEGYLATSETNPATGHYGLSLYWLRRLLQESPVRQRVIWLDCCNSGEFFNILEADPGPRAGTDRLFMAAAREYEPAYESLGSRHSVFTEALLAGLNPSKVEGGVVNGHSLTDAINRSLKGELQQPLFESSGGEIVLTRLSGSVAPTSTASVSTLDRLKHLSYSVCPFQGLAPFDINHGDWFFGREEFTQTLVERVSQARFCALVGSSGIGKTSLLRAGLMAQLQGIGQQQPQSDWDIRYLTPGQAPLQRLAEAFIDVQATGLDRASQLRQAESFLQQGGEGFCQLLQAMAGIESSLRTAPRRLLLVIDQLEEMLGPEVSADLATDRQRFIDGLMAVVEQDRLPVHVVVALRADYLPRLQTFPQLADLVKHQGLIVPAMTYDQIKATIVSPLEKIGLRYDANLIYTLLLDVVGAPGDLALLQMALKEIWRCRQLDPSGQQAPKLTLEAYAELGGVRQLLSQWAHQTYEGLTNLERQVARRCFLSLCEFGEGISLTRRQIQLQELITPSLGPCAVVETLEKLVAARLVVAQTHCSHPQLAYGAAPAWPGVTGDASVEPNSMDQASAWEWAPHFDIAHESLIRTWPLLQEWLQEGRGRLQQQRTLEVAAQQWYQQRCPDQGDYFLPATRLGAAQALAADHPDSLSLQALSYLSAWESHRCRCDRQRRLMKLLIPLSVATGMLVAYGYSLLRQTAPVWQLTQTPPASHPVPNFRTNPPTSPPALKGVGVRIDPGLTVEGPQGPGLETPAGAILPLAPDLRATFQTVLTSIQPWQQPARLEVSDRQMASLMPSDQNQSGLNLDRLEKVAEWPAPDNPNWMIQIWCGRSQPEPVCFTLTDESP